MREIEEMIVLDPRNNIKRLVSRFTAMLKMVNFLLWVLMIVSIRTKKFSIIDLIMLINLQLVILISPYNYWYKVQEFRFSQ